jgi:hypothetical protein
VEEETAQWSSRVRYERRTPSGTPFASAWLALSMLVEDDCERLLRSQSDRWNCHSTSDPSHCGGTMAYKEQALKIEANMLAAGKLPES